jgi:hypothetical protein
MYIMPTNATANNITESRMHTLEAPVSVTPVLAQMNDIVT